MVEYFWSSAMRLCQQLGLKQYMALTGSAFLLIASSSPCASQTIMAPKEDGVTLRARLAPAMNPAGRPMPADASDLDAMLQKGDLTGLAKRLQSAGSAQEIDLNMNWEQAKLYNGAGFIVAYSYMHDLWRLGSGLPATSGDQLKESAGMMFLYTFDLIVADGPKCADLSASTHRRDQLFTQNRPIFDYLRAAPVASKMRMGTVSLSIEAATAQVRTNDAVLCSGGLDEMSEGLKAQGAKPLQPVPNAPGTFGKTYAVPPAPGYKPKFVDDKMWRLKQATARQELPAALTRLLNVSTISQPASTQLTPDQKGYIVYDQCMMHAAIQASHTDAKDEEIFGLARAQCSSTRSAAIEGQENNKQFLAALDAADADKAARFPTWIKGVRERRKASDAKLAAPINAPHP